MKSKKKRNVLSLGDYVWSNAKTREDKKGRKEGGERSLRSPQKRSRELARDMKTRASFIPPRGYFGKVNPGSHENLN